MLVQEQIVTARALPGTKPKYFMMARAISVGMWSGVGILVVRRQCTLMGYYIMFTTFLQLGFAKFIQAKVLVFSGDHFEKTKFLSLKLYSFL